jgi:hypothetical protein
MTESNDNDKLLKQVKTTLDKAAEEIDGATLTRLRAIRREALAAGEKQKPFSRWASVGGLTATATVLVLTVSLLTISPEENVGTLQTMPPLEDIALLSDKADLEFYEELDFYLWLDSGQLNQKQLKGEELANEQHTG